MDDAHTEIERLENKNKKTFRIRKKKETDNDTEMMRAALFKLYLSHDQKNLLNRWFGCARWTYNQAIAFINCKKRTDKVNLKILRQLLVDDSSDAVKQNPWLKETLYDIRDNAVTEALDAYKENCSRVKNGLIDSFKLAYRKRKTGKDSIYMRHRWYKDQDFTIQTWKKMGQPLNMRRGRKLLPNVMQRDGRLIKDKYRDYYLIDTENRDLKAKVNAEENQFGLPTILALDPGNRVFQVGYDFRGRSVEFGIGDQDKIYDMCYGMDRIISRMSGFCRRKRYVVKHKVLPRLRKKIHNKISDIHRKAAKWMCERYDYIMLPTFPVSKMICKKRRKINSKTVRNMLNWSHYRFSVILENKANEYGSILYRCREDYTSQTCGKCGFLTKSGEKIHVCRLCRFIIDRDINGSRNIFLKALTESFVRSAHKSSGVCAHEA
jgi:putative transposase